MTLTVTLNGTPVTAEPGTTVMSLCEAHGTYVPHLCHHPGLEEHGSCRVCVVDMNGRVVPACLTPVSDQAVITTESERIHHLRERLTQLLFTEGQHLCPSCEASGNCQLQAMAYDTGMLEGHFPHAWAPRQIDASHPDLIIDRERCIACTLCVRASHEHDHHDAFLLNGRGADVRLACNSDSGLLRDTTFTGSDQAAHICPTGALLARSGHYRQPVGTRLYDCQSLHQRGNHRADEPHEETP